MRESCFDRALREVTEVLDGTAHNCLEGLQLSFDWEEAERLGLTPDAVRKRWPPKYCGTCGALTYASRLHQLYAAD